MDKDERIRAAIRKLKKANNFSKAQENWINRFEKALMNEPILNINIIDEIPMFREMAEAGDWTGFLTTGLPILLMS